MADAIRFLAADAVEAAKSGHPGLPMGAADIATVLFTQIMKFDPQDPDWPDRDRFILSAGHGSMLLYATLFLLGYEGIDMEEIKKFRQLGSKTAGHPEYGHVKGIETTTGPLGQGIANAVGMAIAEKKLQDEFGKEIVDHRTYCLAGDGCLMEGISQEAISLAGHLKLNKLILIWDNNGISIDGPVSLADSTEQDKRFKACGWEVIKIGGQNHDQILNGLQRAQESEKPVMIDAKTTIGFGAPNKAGTEKSHGAPLGADEVAGARKELEWKAEPFVIPEDIQDAWRIAGLTSAQKHREWKERLETVDPNLRGEFERRQRGEPPNIKRAILGYKQKLADEPITVATRKASEMTLEVINEIIPETIGGSADLTGSNNTKTSQTKPITPDDFGGRFIHYGIREHAMAAAMNGISLHRGLIPYSGTFLIFSDYCRPAIRLAALMGIRTIHVMTHDSIGLGEDGPTHQPVEHLASLRAIPNILIMRPADAVETAECWEIALNNPDKPSVIALTRQSVEQVRVSHEELNMCEYGAYEINKTQDKETMAAIFASGSEVQVAMDAKKELDASGIPTRVVSVPCFELFAQQPEEYRKKIIGIENAKVGVEAAVRQGWDDIIGNGKFIGMDTFGASAPGNKLFEHFGITAENIIDAVKQELKESAKTYKINTQTADSPDSFF